MLQKHLEKCEEIMSAKSEAKDALAKEVHVHQSIHEQYSVQFVF